MENRNPSQVYELHAPQLYFPAQAQYDYNPQLVLPQDTPLVTTSQSPIQITQTIERELGNFYKFFLGLTFGFFFPFIGVIILFATDALLLTRVGALIGTGNLLLFSGSLLLSLFLENRAHPSAAGAMFGEYRNELLYSSVPLIILAAAFFITARFQWKKYLLSLKEALLRTERLPFKCEVGDVWRFMAGFGMSFFFPIIGSLLALVSWSQYLQARFGVLAGLGSFFIVLGGASVFFDYSGLILGNSCLVFGVLLLECTIIHFGREIMKSNIGAREYEIMESGGDAL